MAFILNKSIKTFFILNKSIKIRILLFYKDCVYFKCSRNYTILSYMHLHLLRTAGIQGASTDNRNAHLWIKSFS